MAALLALGCGPGDGLDAEPEAVVFAASSLTEAFTDLERRFEASHPGRGITLHFAGSSTLALQLEQGAAGDVFAPADAAQMQRARAAGRLAGEPATFARNRLAIMVAEGNPLGLERAADLARGGLRVALAGPDVPAGRYAREALADAGVEVASASDEPNVRALVGKVALGELDAAIAYTTDARPAEDAVDAVPLAGERALAPAYPIAALTGGAAPETAALFVDYVLSDAGRAALVASGFRAP